MGPHTLGTVKQLVETWDIRVLMVFSLGIQVCLTCVAPYRKRCSSIWMSLSMWLLYLAADSVALFTIGLIASSMEDSKRGSNKIKADLLSLWAPFLLLHLGGPDTITALALEDNELWPRHGLQLVTQAVITLYVFFRSVKGNRYLLPMLLMFLDGLIKYYERTCALYYASMDTFRDSQRTKPEPGPNYARLMEEYSSALSAHIPTTITGEDGPSNDVVDESRTGGESFGREAVISFQDGNEADTRSDSDRVIRDAYGFYKKFRGLLADTFLSLKDRDESREYFLKKRPREAFRIVQIEVNFMYDVFYTKLFLRQKKRRYARLVCFVSVVAALIIFCFTNNTSHKRIDVGITFALFGGAILLDLVALVMFVLSDWWVITAYNNVRLKYLTMLMMFVLKWSKSARYLLRKRWSESISQYNLLERCLERPPWLFYKIPIKQVQYFLIGWKYIKCDPIDHELVEFIVEELQKKAERAREARSEHELCCARGNLVCLEDYYFISEYLRPWTADIDYDESLLTWHFATDICYWTCSNQDDKYVKFSKTLSYYMSYLVQRQQALVSAVVGSSDVRFDDTRAEVKKFLGGAREAMGLPEFSAKILQVKTPIRPSVAKGDKSKSVLFDSCRLAKQLKLLGDKQWVVISHVWVELLCYAAVRGSPRAHVALLSKGGELITLVWLLLAHLGIGERFRQYRGFGWTKLIIDK